MSATPVCCTCSWSCGPSTTSSPTIKLGASWEGFAIEQVTAVFRQRDTYFWATHGGAELDLMLTLGGKRYGFECKIADAPGSTRSMRIAMRDLGLEHLWILYPGNEAYDLGERLSVLPLRSVNDLAARITGSGA